MNNFKHWLYCIIFFIFWKLILSTDTAKDLLKKAVNQPEISSNGVVANKQSLSPAQIKQIEDIAQSIVVQSNANKQAMLDEMTVSFNATAVGRNVRFERVIQVKKGLPPQNIKAWLYATKAEIVPKVCAQNAKNPAFDRGLSYTFSYSNTYGEKLGDIFVDKATCMTIGF